MIKRVQRAARKYIKNLEQRANRYFDDFAKGPTSGRQDGVIRESDTITTEELRACLRRVRIEHGHSHRDDGAMEEDIDNILANIFKLSLPTTHSSDSEATAAAIATHSTDTATVTRREFRKFLPQARRWNLTVEKKMVSQSSAIEMIRQAHDAKRLRDRLDLRHATHKKVRSGSFTGSMKNIPSFCEEEMGGEKENNTGK